MRIHQRAAGLAALIAVGCAGVALVPGSSAGATSQTSVDVPTAAQTATLSATEKTLLASSDPKLVVMNPTSGDVLSVSGASATALSTSTAPSAPAGTTAVYETPTSGNFVNSSGEVVGGWADLGFSTTEDPTKTEDGGTWTYGDYFSLGLKHCYSDYQNNKKKHSATAKMFPAGTDKVTKQAGIEAKASRAWPADVTCIGTPTSDKNTAAKLQRLPIMTRRAREAINQWVHP